MRMNRAEFLPGYGSRPFWTLVLRLAVLAAAAVAALVFLVATLVVVVPVLVLGGLALHLYLRWRLSRASRPSTAFDQAFDRRERSYRGGETIEVEYTVIERR
jgi:Flp pilus assembly protein TadB